MLSIDSTCDIGIIRTVIYRHTPQSSWVNIYHIKTVYGFPNLLEPKQAYPLILFSWILKLFQYELTLMISTVQWSQSCQNPLPWMRYDNQANRTHIIWRECRYLIQTTKLCGNLNNFGLDGQDGNLVALNSFEKWSLLNHCFQNYHQGTGNRLICCQWCQYTM